MERSGVNLKIHNVNTSDKLLVRLGVEMESQLTGAEDLEQNRLRPGTAEQGQENSHSNATEAWLEAPQGLLCGGPGHGRGPHKMVNFTSETLTKGHREERKTPGAFSKD